MSVRTVPIIKVINNNNNQSQSPIMVSPFMPSMIINFPIMTRALSESALDVSIRDSPSPSINHVILNYIQYVSELMFRHLHMIEEYLLVLKLKELYPNADTTTILNKAIEQQVIKRSLDKKGHPVIIALSK